MKKRYEMTKKALRDEDEKGCKMTKSAAVTERLLYQ
jgi:hypothetical protein